MCGIFGNIGGELSQRVLNSLSHRGPDSSGLETVASGCGNVRLGHTRLAILDLSQTGHQPMRSNDSRWWLTFNGEIYNHLGLRKSLDSSFRGHSDTETLVELVAQHGIDRALPKLNGMFGFAALDVKEQKLYLVRDPFGIKPVYYTQGSGHFAFASEVRALRAMGLVGGIDQHGLQQFLTLRYVPSPKTLWLGIQRLPPGHLLCYDITTGSATLSPYIKPTQLRFQGSEDDAIQAYREHLSLAVKRQLLSDVPVGILLSGGVDSALVAAMAKDAGRDLPCFSVGFGAEHAECELDDAAHTARILKLPFHRVTVTPEQLQTALPAIARAVEEPLGTTSVMPMWELVRRTREDVTVVLTGQGTDEPWGGYYRYQVELLRAGLPWSRLWKASRRLSTGWPNKPDVIERGLRALSEADTAQRFEEASALFSASQRQQILGDKGDGGARIQIQSWLDWLEEAGNLPSVEKMMRLDTRMNLADDLLLYGDKISMAVSLEARVPMLDLDLVRFVESLPIAYRIRWRQGKVLHKRMAENYLPEEIVHRPKKGFQVPFGHWSRNQWKNWIETLLLEGLEDILHKPAVEQLWRQHLQKKPDRSRQIYALLMLALWKQEQYRE